MRDSSVGGQVAQMAAHSAHLQKFPLQVKATRAWWLLGKASDPTIVPHVTTFLSNASEFAPDVVVRERHLYLRRDRIHTVPDVSNDRSAKEPNRMARKALWPQGVTCKVVGQAAGVGPCSVSG